MKRWVAISLCVAAGALGSIVVMASPRVAFSPNLSAPVAVAPTPSIRTGSSQVPPLPVAPSSGSFTPVAPLPLPSTRTTPSPDPNRETVSAPIDRLEVVVRESSPQQVVVQLTVGLPSGCAKPHSYSTSRSGDTFTITVLNSMANDNRTCTMIYGQYGLSIELPGPFTPGTTYTVTVNDKTTTFTI